MMGVLPPNSTRLESVLFDTVSHALSSIGDPVADMRNADAAPHAFLPFLAWAFSVDAWNSAWGEDVKRAAIAASVRVHRIKGTVRALKDVLGAAGYGDAIVVEQYGHEFHDGSAQFDGRTAYTPPDHWAEYRVLLTRPITSEQAAFVRTLCARVAPARSHLKALDFTRALNEHRAGINFDGAYTHGVA